MTIFAKGIDKFTKNVLFGWDFDQNKRIVSSLLLIILDPAMFTLLKVNLNKVKVGRHPKAFLKDFMRRFAALLVKIFFLMSAKYQINK